MDPLRKFDVTLGREIEKKFNAGIIVARPNATFLRLWYDSFKHYVPYSWDYNSATVPYRLYMMRPAARRAELLHVEPYRLTTPDWLDRGNLLIKVIDWRDLYVVHTMLHHESYTFTPENVRRLSTTLGEVIRYIYYGSPKII